MAPLAFFRFKHSEFMTGGDYGIKLQGFFYTT